MKENFRPQGKASIQLQHCHVNIKKPEGSGFCLVIPGGLPVIFIFHEVCCRGTISPFLPPQAALLYTHPPFFRLLVPF